MSLSHLDMRLLVLLTDQDTYTILSEQASKKFSDKDVGDNINVQRNMRNYPAKIIFRGDYCNCYFFKLHFLLLFLNIFVRCENFDFCVCLKSIALKSIILNYRFRRCCSSVALIGNMGQFGAKKYFTVRRAAKTCAAVKGN